MCMAELTFHISDAAYDLLKKIGNGAAEYRDHRYKTLEEFEASPDYKEGIRSKNWFLNRNYGGTYYLIEELYDAGLVEPDGESWHLTYVLTPFGKKFLK